MATPCRDYVVELVVAIVANGTIVCGTAEYEGSERSLTFKTTASEALISPIKR